VSIGFTTVDVPFQDILNGGRVIAVFDEADPDTMIACGAVGGVLDGNGAMSIGLAPVGGSGVVGVAYLNGRFDATAAGISIFVLHQPGIEAIAPAN
jgi:hypothetical protein